MAIGRIDIDSYMARPYHLVRSNCWHLVDDAWFELTGIRLGDRTPERITRDALMNRFRDDVPDFVLLPGPREPSIVLMRNPGVVPHVGVYVTGKVLQMTRTGVSFTPPRMATLGFRDVGYYTNGPNPDRR